MPVELKDLITYAITDGENIFRYCEQPCFRVGVAQFVEQNEKVAFTRIEKDEVAEFRWLLS